MIMNQLPLIPSIIISIFLVLGGLVTLIGSLGLLRFKDFSERIHTTAMGSSLGAFLILIASGVMTYSLGDRVIFHEVVIMMVLFLSSPISAMLLMRSYILREERRHDSH